MPLCIKNLEIVSPCKYTRVFAFILTFSQISESAERMSIHHVYCSDGSQTDSVTHIFSSKAFASKRDIAWSNTQMSLIEGDAIVGRDEHACHWVIVDAIHAVTHTRNLTRSLGGRTHLTLYERTCHGYGRTGQRIPIIYLACT